MPHVYFPNSYLGFWLVFSLAAMNHGSQSSQIYFPLLGSGAVLRVLKLSNNLCLQSQEMYSTVCASILLASFSPHEVTILC